MSETLPIAHRVWAEPKDRNDRRRQRPAQAPPRGFLVFDTETKTDASQALTFGCWQYCRIDSGGVFVADEGLFYADDLEKSDPEGFAVLLRYVKDHLGTHGRALRLLSRGRFVEEVFYRVAYKGRAQVVGFNLPFDISRIAVDVAEARGFYRGGFSFILSKGADGSGFTERRHRPRVLVKHRDTKGSFISFTKPMSPDEDDLIPEESLDQKPNAKYRWPGRFLDLRTLAFALTGTSYSLDRACSDFGVTGKVDSGGYGHVTTEHVDYCRQDVTATRELRRALLDEFERHPVQLDPEKAVSPASMAKAYLTAMGITPVLDRLPEFPRSELGYSMAAFFGGRAECRIRRTPVPVALVDYTSMYPTVSALMDLYPLKVARDIEIEEATAEVSELLRSVTLEDCLDLQTWRQFVGCALVQPDGDILPLRAAYDGSSWGIGLNVVTSEEPLWYSIADCVASVLLSGKAPKVLQAWRLRPSGRITGLNSVQLGGAVTIDPGRGDPIIAMVEERQRVKRSSTIADGERRRTERALKLVGNSGAYGIFSEFNPRERLKGHTTPVTVYSRRRDPFGDRVSAPEDGGKYCFPPFATVITGAARLMLAILERCVTDLGGTYAICDTDSMAIVATSEGGFVPYPGGTAEGPEGPGVLALSFAQVDEIRQRVNALNPYDRTVVPDILKLEAQSWCYSISAKRYALFVFDDKGEPVLLSGDQAPSEHGLGQYLDPSGSESESWIAELWIVILRRALGLSSEEPPWFQRHTFLRSTVTSLAELRVFDTYNEGLDYQGRIKPFNFFISAAGAKPPAGLELRGSFRLVAPWESDASKWDEVDFSDAHHPALGPFRVSTRPDRPGVAKVETFADMAAKYGTHPEFKSCDAEGQPCTRVTVGLLQRRRVTVGRIVLIGKESNRLEERETGTLTREDAEQWLTTYEDHDEWYRIVLPALKLKGIAVVACATGLSERRVRDILAGRALPHRSNRETLRALVVERP
jgi:hypothetical protein